MGEGLLVRKGGGGVGERTTTPSINFVSKELININNLASANIVCTFTNNDEEQVEIYYGTTLPLTNTVVLAANTTSSNITLSGLSANTTVTISAYAIATNPTSKKIKSEIVSSDVTTDSAQVFLKRTRTAFGQLETRTRTAANVQVCVVTEQGGNAGCFESTAYINTQVVDLGRPACTTNSSGFWFAIFLGVKQGSTCVGANPYMLVRRDQILQTQCQFGGFTAWTATTSCSTATPNCSVGAVIRECRTVYDFREQDWSEYETVNFCESQTPTAGLNAVQIECVLQ